MKYIDAEKLVDKIWEICDYASEHWDVEEERGAYNFAKRLTDFIDSLQQEQSMPDSTKLIELWDETKEMLKEKDFRDDPWRLAYNAFMCGFGRGIAVKKQEQPEVDKFDCPATPIEEAIEVTSRMQHIDEEMKPIAKFIMDYASWNLHKDEWNQPVIEVPLFRVLDALVQRGKPYCCSG